MRSCLTLSRCCKPGVNISKYSLEVPYMPMSLVFAFLPLRHNQMLIQRLENYLGTCWEGLHSLGTFRCGAGCAATRGRGMLLNHKTNTVDNNAKPVV